MKNSFFFVVLGLAAILWSSSVCLSTSLSGNQSWLTPGSGTDDEIGRIRQLASSSNSVETLLTLAQKLEEQGLAKGRSDLIIEALENYRRILELNPNQEQALLRIGSISAEMGVFDKAVSFFDRYLILHPDDLNIQTDLAFAQLKLGNQEKALSIFKELTIKLPEVFLVHLGLGFALAESGRKDEALVALAVASQKARTAEERSQVEKTIAGLKNSSAALVSPANEIVEFFLQNEILGEKITNFRWLTATSLEISVSNFPVEQMPPFAKDKFTKTVSSKFAHLPEPIQITVIDSDSKTPLLLFDVGIRTDTSSDK